VESRRLDELTPTRGEADDAGRSGDEEGSVSIRGREGSIDAPALAAFREIFRGEVVLPGDPGYDAARIVWNGVVDRHPAIVVRPTGAADVISAVRFARERDLLVAVRSGGHSVGGFSTCDGGVVIDLSRMRGVRVDPDRRLARVNGGTLLSELDHEAQAFGLACPVGVVGHTGVAGLSLGGGMGRLQRRYGLTVDNLVSVDLVTADGSLLHVSEDENADLFWGIRGAGPNFGVVTSFEFRLHEVGPRVTNGSVVYPIERAREMVGVFSELARAAPEEAMLTLGFAIVGPEDPWPELVGQPVLIMGATHSGSVEDAERDLKPLRGNGELADSFTLKSYLALQAANDESMGWGKRFYMKGGFVNELSEGLVDVCTERAAESPGECNVGFWAQGGAVARVPEEAMAFTGRDAAFWVGAETLWTDPADDAAYVAWGRETMDALKPFTAEGAYVNDIVESGVEVARGIYGDVKYERLVALKRAHDPDNVFRLNQNVKP
jgi:FAD/FMN-containing dehydrogenase